MCALCSPEEILFMQEFAKSKAMEIIPLVQTFGHMEVKLKPFSFIFIISCIIVLTLLSCIIS